MAKKSTYKTRLSYINRTLKNLEKRGLDTALALRGKTVEQLAKTKKSLEQFKYGVKVAKERPGIERTLEKYHARISEKNLYGMKVEIGKIVRKQIKEVKETSSQHSYNLLKLEQEKIAQFSDLYEINDISKLKELKKKIIDFPLKDILSGLTEKRGNEFFGRYFKLLEGDTRADEKLDRIKELIGNDLGYLDDLMDTLISHEFKGDFDSEGARSGRVYYEDSYREMEERLDKLYGMVLAKKG